MAEALEEFFPILIENYIRFETAKRYVQIRDEGTDTPLTTKFKIAKEYYEKIINFDVTAPLIGLELSYDEASSILSVEPTDYFKELYENKIMSDVALKQSNESVGRYSNFIEVIE